MNFQEHKSQVADRLQDALSEILAIKEDLFDKIEEHHFDTIDQFCSFKYNFKFSEKIAYYFYCTFSPLQIAINLVAEDSVSGELSALSTLILKLDIGCEPSMFTETSRREYAEDLAEKICLFNSNHSG